MLELGQVVNGAAEWVCSNGLVYKALRNPVVVALLITVLAMAVVFAICRPGAASRRDWQTSLRCGFYLFLGVSALVARTVNGSILFVLARCYGLCRRRSLRDEALLRHRVTSTEYEDLIEAAAR